MSSEAAMNSAVCVLYCVQGTSLRSAHQRIPHCKQSDSAHFHTMQFHTALFIAASEDTSTCLLKEEDTTGPKISDFETDNSCLSKNYLFQIYMRKGA